MVGEAKPMAEEEVAAALASGPFAAAWARGAPVVVAVGSPPRASFATPAALALVGVGALADLDAALLAAESPGARRLRRLAEVLTPGGAPRLESLRFYSHGSPLALSLLSARVASPGGAVWLVMAAPFAAAVAESKPEDAGEPAPPAGFSPPPLDGPVRFLWSLDAAGRFVAPDPALARRLGPNAPEPEETLAALSARLGLGSAWIEAVAARATFSGLRLAWREPGDARARMIKLSGSPAFDRERAYAGFRGFGVFTGEAVAIEPPSAPAAPEPTPRAIDASPVAEAPPVVDALPPAPSEPAKAPPEVWLPRPGAEIVMLRPGGGASQSKNVVPIRPGALGVLTSSFVEDDPAHAHESVELSYHERDAFREIARALGVRSRPEREGDSSAPESTNPLAGLGFEPDGEPAGDWRAIIDALPIGVLILRAGKALYANKALLEFTGFDSMAALEADDAVTRLFGGHDPHALAADADDLPVVARDGEVIAAHARAQDIAWAGAPATLLSLRRSRDREHLARASALEGEARGHAARADAYARAIDVASDGYVRVDGEGRVLEMSPRAEKLFGYTLRECAGQSFLMLLAPASQAAATAAQKDALKRELGSRPVRLAVEARDHAGRIFPAALSFGRLAPQGEAFFVVEDQEIADRTESERAAALQAARAVSERKTEFLAAVSHEIRTPINAILGFTEVMIEERFGPIGNERYRDYLKDIHTSGRHVVSLANDLIDLAKVESGKLELELEPIDVNQIIRDCVAMMQPQASRERIIMRMSLSERLPNVMADRRSLRQIMLNLMSNAVKYNEPGGQVIVSTALDETGQMVIRVRDTGVGMSEAELGLAMEPFRRAGAKTGEGSGLGLPLTKALVEANHADMSIKSRKDQGTLVEVAFPSPQAAQ